MSHGEWSPPRNFFNLADRILVSSAYITDSCYCCYTVLLAPLRPGHLEGRLFFPHIVPNTQYWWVPQIFITQRAYVVRQKNVCTLLWEICGASLPKFYRRTLFSTSLLSKFFYQVWVFIDRHFSWHVLLSNFFYQFCAIIDERFLVSFK